VGAGSMCMWECVEVRTLFSFYFFIYFVVTGNAAMQNRGRWSFSLFFFSGQHFNQSRNRGWGKEGEGGEWLAGEGGGVGDIGGTSRAHVE